MVAAAVDCFLVELANTGFKSISAFNSWVDSRSTEKCKVTISRHDFTVDADYDDSDCSTIPEDESRLDENELENLEEENDTDIAEYLNRKGEKDDDADNNEEEDCASIDEDQKLYQDFINSTLNGDKLTGRNDPEDKDYPSVGQKLFNDALQRLLDTINHQLSNVSYRSSRYERLVSMNDALKFVINRRYSKIWEGLLEQVSKSEGRRKALPYDTSVLLESSSKTTWPAPEPGPENRLVQEKAQLTSLSTAVAEHQLTESFACSGIISIRDDSEIDDFRTSKPVRLAWITGNEVTDGNIQLPCQSMTDLSRDMDKLIDSCSKATFGRGQEDVLDEDYRRASKLDASQFLTSFDPYHLGIVDQIQQVLCRGVENINISHWPGVVAELYSLNVRAMHLKN